MKYLILFSFIYYPILSISAESSCIEKKTSVPLCPNSGSTLLDETYPTKSFVISTKSFSNKEETDVGLEVSADFISKVIKSYNSSDEKPSIVVPTGTSSYNELIQKIKVNLKDKGFSEESINKKLSYVKQADVNPYIWQQDFFESFVDPSTGVPNMRPIVSYDSKLKSGTGQGVGLYSESIRNTLECVEKGAPLRSNIIKGMFKGTYTDALEQRSNGSSSLADRIETASWKNGEMGGNIEGLPGGLCLKGNNQANKFVEQYCGSIENTVEVDVGWLSVGHVDELVKVVPIFPKTEPLECSFSIWLASPSKALEVMEDPKYSKRAFIEQDDDDSTEFKDIFSHAKRTGICDLLKNYDPSGSKPNRKPRSGIIEAYLRKLISNFSIDAYAGSSSTSNSKCEPKLKEITNGEMAKLMRDDQEYALTNKLVQEKMNETKEKISKSLKERLPNCKNINFVDVPDLFYNNGGFAEIDGKKHLPQPGIAGSLFQNPTNSVLANKTMIIPETPNHGFNEYMSKVSKEQGIEAQYVDTWNFSHTGDGNMHCSSHSLPYCRPRGDI